MESNMVVAALSNWYISSLTELCDLIATAQVKCDFDRLRADHADSRKAVLILNEARLLELLFLSMSSNRSSSSSIRQQLSSLLLWKVFGSNTVLDLPFA